MTKRQIIKWLEFKKKAALEKVEKQSAQAFDAYFNKRNEEIGLNEKAKQISDLMSQACDTIEAFCQEVAQKYPGTVILSNCYGSMKVRLSAICSPGKVSTKLLREFDDGDTPAMKHLCDWIDSTRSQVNTTYCSVIATVANMPNAKQAMEYLKDLGFDLNELMNSIEKPMTTALSTSIDTRFLFIGDDRNEME